jgi:membrane protease YdiL (CAAX protease family)
MSLKTVLRQHPLAAYFLLAYGLPWACILALLASKGFRLAAVQPSDGVVMFLFLILGPSLTSLGLSALLDGRAGLRALWQRQTRWRIGWPWYAIALLTVPLLALAILFALSALVSRGYVPRFELVGLAIGGLAGGLEEIGWTGFATPRLLQRFNPLKSGLLLGLLWAGWHLLADLSSNLSTMGALWPLWFVLFWIVPLTAHRLLMTWVYSRTHSLLVAQLMHASYTGWLLTLSPELGTAPGLVWQTLFAASLWLVVAVVMSSHRQEWLGRRPFAVIQPHWPPKSQPS